MSKSKDNPNRFTDTYIRIGIRISYYRKLRGYTQAQLAEKVDMSPGYLSQIEAPGMAVSISLDMLLSIAEALQIPPAKLLEAEDI